MELPLHYMTKTRRERDLNSEHLRWKHKEMSFHLKVIEVASAYSINKITQLLVGRYQAKPSQGTAPSLYDKN